MSLIIGFDVKVSPESIPEAGGTITISCDASTDGGATALHADYTIRDHPYVFAPSSPGNPKLVKGPNHPVSPAPRDFSQRLTLRKSPSTAPRHELVFIDFQVTEVGGAVSETRTATITVE